MFRSDRVKEAGLIIWKVALISFFEIKIVKAAKRKKLCHMFILQQEDNPKHTHRAAMRPEQNFVWKWTN